MLVKEAKAIVNISNGNSKMPGTTFAQDSFACNVGSRLAKVKGSICEGCYARRIQKMRPSVNQGWTRNYESAVKLIATNPEKWIAACVFQILRQAKKTGENYHRWFDSGDIDSIDQLIAICDVAKDTPNIKHWLPTRELAIVKSYLERFGSFPDNLVVRVSSPMVGDKPLKGHKLTSTVHRAKEVAYGVTCPAPTQGNSCGDCRNCWSHDVPNISYKKH
jgi:hypothetical protein